MKLIKELIKKEEKEEIMNKVTYFHVKLAKELLAPVMHLAETDTKFQDYVEAVAARLARFEQEVLSDK